MVEQTLLMGVLMLALLLVIIFFVSPAFSGALRPLGDRIAGPGFWRFGAKAAKAGTRGGAYATRSGGRGEARPLYYEKRRADTVVVLTAEQRDELEQLADLGLGPAAAVKHARALLMAADGASSADIAHQLGVSEKVVREWLWKAMARPVVCSAAGDGTVCRGRLPVRVHGHRRTVRVASARGARKAR